jgi:hypothetical protein
MNCTVSEAAQLHRLVAGDAPPLVDAGAPEDAYGEVRELATIDAGDGNTLERVVDRLSEMGGRDAVKQLQRVMPVVRRAKRGNSRYRYSKGRVRIAGYTLEVLRNRRGVKAVSCDLSCHRPHDN